MAFDLAGTAARERDACGLSRDDLDGRAVGLAAGLRLDRVLAWAQAGLPEPRAVDDRCATDLQIRGERTHEDLGRGGKADERAFERAGTDELDRDVLGAGGDVARVAFAAVPRVRVQGV